MWFGMYHNVSHISTKSLSYSLHLWVSWRSVFPKWTWMCYNASCERKLAHSSSFKTGENTRGVLLGKMKPFCHGKENLPPYPITHTHTFWTKKDDLNAHAQTHTHTHTHTHTPPSIKWQELSRWIGPLSPLCQCGGMISHLRMDLYYQREE